MKRRIDPGQPRESIVFEFDGESLTGLEGDTLASALLAADHDILSRSIKYHRPRGPFCLQGRCSHCLVRIDGIPDLPACVTPLTPGLRVSSQNAFPSAKHDLLSAIDLAYPKGMDHHTMFAGVPIAQDVMARVARQIAGLGPLPDTSGAVEAPIRRHSADIAIIGGGPAGLACARALADTDARVTLFEGGANLGGRLCSGLDPEQPEIPSAANLTLRTASVVLAVYLEERLPLLTVRDLRSGALEVIEAGAIAYCTGTNQPILPFSSNDLPGIYATRGLAQMITQQRVLPGSRAVLIGSDPDTLALAHLVQGCGAEIVGIVDPDGLPAPVPYPHFKGHRPIQAQGRSAVRGLVIEGASGRQTLACDLIAVSGRAPAFELPRQAGAPVAFDPQISAYRVVPNVDGTLGHPRLFAAGETLGTATVAEARASGAALAVTLLRSTR